MNPSQESISEAQRTTESSAGPGRRLRALRESRGIEIERVIAQLHLQRDIVEALEQDRYEDLPPPVFVAGYLKSYARLLGTDPEPIVTAYRTIALGDAPQTALPKTHARKPKSLGAWLWILALALIAGGSAGGFLWWQGQQDSAQTQDEPQENASAIDSDTDSGSAEDEKMAETTADEESTGTAMTIPPEAIPLRRQQPSSPPSEPSAQAPREPLEAVAAPTPPQTSPEEPAQDADQPVSQPESNGPPEVALEFTGTTWIDVRDAQGKVVLNGEMREGDRRVLTGEAPYKLVIGNAAATRMTVAGEAFDLEKHARGNVARFSLDPTDPQ